jgi:hypothetical protein
VPIVRIETWINAPAETCFDVARSVEAHTASTARSSERAVSGVTTGMLELGDEVTWEARNLGQRLRRIVGRRRIDMRRERAMPLLALRRSVGEAGEQREHECSDDPHQR